VTIWSDVDEPVLQWLLKSSDNAEWRSGMLELSLYGPEDCADELGLSLDSRQLHEALTRLRDYGLIAGKLHLSECAIWSHLRLTADGLIVLGEWPDLDGVASFEGLQALLARLAAGVEDNDERSALRRAAGAIGRLGKGVVDSELESLSEGIA
jgi:hypothetical protein